MVFIYFGLGVAVGVAAIVLFAALVAASRYDDHFDR